MGPFHKQKHPGTISQTRCITSSPLLLEKFIKRLVPGKVILLSVTLLHAMEWNMKQTILRLREKMPLLVNVELHLEKKTKQEMISFVLSTLTPIALTRQNQMSEVRMCQFKLVPIIQGKIIAGQWLVYMTRDIFWK